MDAKVELVGFILFISLVLTAIAKSPPINAQQCNKPHERFSPCLLAECAPKTCDDVGKRIACSSVRPSGCVEGCICEEGYVKDKDGNCIEAKSCPFCGGDLNAMSAENGCDNTCRQTCASLRSNTRNKTDTSAVESCVSLCELNGCDCKKGYILNTDVWVGPPTCVLPEDCNIPKQCNKPHERYSECILAVCRHLTCDNLGKPVYCPFIIPPCAGGCICEQGYVADKDGNCIDAKSCPSKCKGPHEEYIYCAARRRGPITCEDLITVITPTPRLEGCPAECVCEEGYLRDSKGMCIKKEQCPQ